MAGSPELGDTRGAQHEGVPEQIRGVQEPSHGGHDGGEFISATPCWKIDNISFSIDLII